MGNTLLFYLMASFQARASLLHTFPWNFRTTAGLLLALAFILPLGSLAQTSKSALFIGNSYTYANNLPNMIQDVAQSKGRQFSYASSLLGGFAWYNHILFPPSLALIDSASYDYMILQDQSLQLAVGRGAFAKHQHSSFRFADGLDLRSKRVDTCHKTMLFLTWGRKPGNIWYYPTSPFGANYGEMQGNLSENYLQLAGVIGAEVAPVGEAWRRVVNDFQQIDLYAGDGSHPSLAGTYLAACVFYASIFQDSVSGAWHPAGLSAATAQTLQSVADQVVVGAWADWNIDTTSQACISEPLATNNSLWAEISTPLEIAVPFRPNGQTAFKNPNSMANNKRWDESALIADASHRYLEA